MRRERDGGQAAVELALVLPLVVLLLLAVVQVTLVARDQILVVHAARNAARAAAVDAGSDGAAARRAAHESLKSGAVRVDVQRVGADRRELVVVNVRYTSATDVPLVGRLLPDVPLSAKAAMRAETAADQGFFVPGGRFPAGTGRPGSEHSRRRRCAGTRISIRGRHDPTA
ncbi:MAG TPA: TadE/TadG family type IV pilus assembly protein [Acidimicrobiales bacterium]|nr:TadE/TadG family type IV pilus assembly protein [Acidimicrobiales bacterium]